jgi:hypothetical protein
VIGVDEAPTVVMPSPFAPAADPDSGAVTVVRAIVPRDPIGEREGSSEPPSGEGRDGGGPLEALEVGGDDAFILAWGRGHEALRSRSRQLVLSMMLNGCLAGVVGYLAWRNEHKETYVFVRDSLGNVVQADARGFLRAGDRRSEVEIKGFVRRFVTDAFTWTPLDVEDRLRAALRVVDGRAQAVVKAGLRLAERRALVDNGTSGRVWDEPRTSREPQIVIERSDPLEVLVAFDRYLIDSGGAREEAGGLFARVTLKEVPRSPANPYGLVVVDARISERL